MPPDLAPVLGLLLHEGGWDEVLMVAAALGIAYLVIVWTGRRNQDEEEEWDGGRGRGRGATGGQVRPEAEPALVTFSVL